tara:strand:- start:2663 stop:3547 length:885 start_codon:yes stop_codon:yes gene_type:complete
MTRFVEYNFINTEGKGSQYYIDNLDHFELTFNFDKTTDNNYKELLIDFCKTITNPGIMFSGGLDSLLVGHSFHEAGVNANHITYKIYDGNICLNEYETSFADKFCQDYKKDQIIRRMDYQELVEIYLNTNYWSPHPDLFMQYHSVEEFNKQFTICFGLPYPAHMKFRKGKLCLTQIYKGISSSTHPSFPYYGRFQTPTPAIGTAFFINDFIKNLKDTTKGDFDSGWKHEYYTWLGYNLEPQNKIYIMENNIVDKKQEFMDLKPAPTKWKCFISIPYKQFLNDYENNNQITYRSN